MSESAKRPPVVSALVLAAGRGTRLGSAAGEIPKPLVRVGGLPAIEWNLRLLRSAGISTVWINLHYLGQSIVDEVGDGSRLGLTVRYAWEKELLGTAGAAKNLELVLTAPQFVVAYGDNVIDLDLPGMVRWHLKAGAVATIAVFDPLEVPNTGLAGGRLSVDRDGFVTSFTEGTVSMLRYVNAGVYVLHRAILDVIPPGTFSDFGRDVFPALLARSIPVRAYEVRGYCLAIDTPEALSRAEDILAGLASVNGKPASLAALSQW